MRPRLMKDGRLIEPSTKIPSTAYARIFSMLPLDTRGTTLRVFEERRKIQSEIDQAYGRGMLRPTLRMLAKETSLDPKTVRVALRQLEAISYVETTRRKQRRLPINR